MTKELSGNDTFPATLTVPVTGDFATEALFDQAFQDLADRTRYLFNRIGSGVPTLAANRFLARASTGVTEGKPATDFMIGFMALAGAINGADALHTEGSDVASASSVSLANATGMSVLITGSTDIASFGAANAGIVRFLRFQGTLNLEHSASLLLPGNSDITTQANDRAIAVSLGGGVWMVFTYERAAPSPLVATLQLQTNDEYDASVVHDAPLTGLLSHAEIVHITRAGSENEVTGIAMSAAAVRKKTFVWNVPGQTVAFVANKPSGIESAPENQFDFGDEDRLELTFGQSATFYYDPDNMIVRLLHAHPEHFRTS